MSPMEGLYNNYNCVVMLLFYFPAPFIADELKLYMETRQEKVVSPEKYRLVEIRLKYETNYPSRIITSVVRL